MLFFSNLMICNLLRISYDFFLGEADVLKEFEINEGRKKVKVAGCRCIKGVLKKSGLYKLVRNGEVLFRGTYLLQIIDYLVFILFKLMSDSLFRIS